MRENALSDSPDRPTNPDGAPATAPALHHPPHQSIRDRLHPHRPAHRWIRAKLTAGVPGLDLVASVRDSRSVVLTTNPTRLLPGSVVRQLSPVRRLPFLLYWRSEKISPPLRGLLSVVAALAPRGAR